MAVFRVRPLPKGRQIGRKYRKPKLYSEKITKAHYTDKEKLDMLTDSIKQTKWEQCRLKAKADRKSSRLMRTLNVLESMCFWICSKCLICEIIIILEPGSKNGTFVNPPYYN